jgi:polyisoprenoid-binding protein YceI
MRWLPTLLLASVALCAVPEADADAGEYRMQPGSYLQFTSSYDGESFDGRFSRFEPALRFDPAALDSSRFDVRIDLASASTGHDERDEVLVGDEFLDAQGLATARYVATTFRSLGEGRFVAEGTLTLRGIEQPVALEFAWRPGRRPVLDGEATVKRLAFGVGEGDWADTSVLPDEVKVKTHLVLAPLAD